MIKLNLDKKINNLSTEVIDVPTNIQQEMNSIVNKFLNTSNRQEVKAAIYNNLKLYLDDCVSNNLIESYGNISVYARDSSSVDINISPSIKFRKVMMKYIYIGETCKYQTNSIEIDLIQGDLYECECDYYSHSIDRILINGRLISLRVKNSEFKEQAKYREERIEEILKD